MLTRILSALIAAPLFLAVLAVAPPIWTAVMLACIVGIAAYELLRAAHAAHKTGVCVLTVCAAAAVPFVIYFGIDAWALWLIALGLLSMLFLLAIISYEKENHLTAEQILYCLLAGFVIPSFLAALLRLRLGAQGRYAVLLPVVVTFAADTGAYFTGMLLGKHRGITKVSPNKSAEGFFGGLVWGVGFLLLYALALDHFFAVEADLARIALYGLVGALAAELGDLAFSLMKRQFGVKDYGNLLPGHGGMLDRFDSMSFVAPAIWILMTALPAL